MTSRRLTQRPGLPGFQHGEDTVHLTMARQTTIRMPNLHEDEGLGALFVLDEDVPHRVS